MPGEPQTPFLSEVTEQGALALRRQIRAVFALLELPKRWQGLEPKEIAESFIEVIIHLLRLDLALIRVLDTNSVIDQHFPRALDGEALLAAIQEGRGAVPVEFPLPEPNTVGHTTARVVAFSPLGEQGIVIVGSWRENFPTAHELRLLQAATTQAALAMQSSREARAQLCLLEEQTRLQRVNASLARLHAFSDGLSRAHTSAQVANVILSEGLAAVSARMGSVFLVDDAHLELRLVRAVRHGEALQRLPQNIPLTTAQPLAEAFRNKRGLYLALSDDTSAECYGLPRARVAAVAAAPLMVDDHCLGMLSLGFTEPRSFAEEERAFIQAIAWQAAQACDRVRLLEAERQARVEAEERQQRADFLSEASAIFGSSLDFLEALTRIARLVVPRFADWVLLQVSDRVSSSLEQPRTVLVHRDPSKVELAREYSRGLLATRAEGRACITNNSVIAPICAQGRPLGVIILGAEASGLYGSRALAMVEELGLRAGAALEHAQLYAAAREADRRKDEFLAMLGHELRNPLSPILTALELMRLKDPHSFSREQTIIERQIEHMVRLVDDLLDVSRITRGKIQLKRARVELAGILAKAIEMTTPLLEQRSHHLELAPPAEPLFIEGDSARLAQVLANLLNNAAKYTDPGGRIRVSAAREGAQVVLRVRDSGTGISPEVLPKIFEMFVQDGRAIDRSQGGLGLGLAIVRSLVELHGGAVSAHSEGVGRGSEFVVRLPLAKALPQADSAVTQPGAARQAPGSPRPSLRVLVVDDNQDAAEMLAEFLGSAGFITRTAFDGPTGLEVASAFCPDVALLDIGLPVMDGYELAGRIRAQAGLRGIKLIALTGYGQESDRHRAQEAGFDLHVVKPVDLPHLLGALRGFARDSAGGRLRAHPGDEPAPVLDGVGVQELQLRPSREEEPDHQGLGDRALDDARAHEDDAAEPFQPDLPDEVAPGLRVGG